MREFDVRFSMSIRTQIFGGGAEHRLLKEKQPKETAEFKSLSDISIPREETRRTDGREQDRFRLTGARSAVTYDGRNYDAEVINLSGGGAMVAGAMKPNIGERIDLQLGEDSTIECAVRWIKGGRLGLEFAHETKLECSDDEHSALLRDVISRNFPDQKFESPEPVTEVPEEGAESAEGAEETSDNRAARRHPLIWLGELQYRSHKWDVRLRNISCSGALVECPGPLQVDSEVLLDLGKAGTLTCSVSWSVGDHVGLRFDEPFDMRLLSEKKPMIAPATWVRPAYLEAHAQSDSAWESAWGRVSVDELRMELEGYLKR